MCAVSKVKYALIYIIGNVIIFLIVKTMYVSSVLWWGKKKKHQNITLCEEWQGMLFGKPCSSDHQCKQCWWAPEPVGLGSKSSWSCCGILVYPHKKQGCFLAQLPPHDLNTCWFLSVLCPLNGCIFQVRQHMQIKNLKKIKITIYKTDQKKFSFIFF